MKKLLLLIFVFISLNVYSQKIDTCICFTKPELINIAHNIKQLKYQDSTKTEIIKQQDSVIIDQKDVITKDSVIITSDSIVIGKFKENEENYKGIITDYKTMGVMKKTLYFTYGILPGIIIGVLLRR
jgi:antitoxin component YwqK of YwqJK toxin-antitoxin module